MEDEEIAIEDVIEYINAYIVSTTLEAYIIATDFENACRIDGVEWRDGPEVNWQVARPLIDDCISDAFTNLR